MRGTPLRVLHQRNGWYLVQTPDEYLGWMDDGLVLFTKEEFNSWTRQPKVIVTAPCAHTVASLSSDSDIVSDVVAGDIVKLVNEQGEWYNVEYPDGRRGFLARTAAEPLAIWLANRSEAPEQIIATAKRFMGVPYLWGGTSPKAMDCSGFTKTVFFLHGVMLPRDASQQARIGLPITPAANFENVQVGDLLLFGKKDDRTQRESVTHVGIYLCNGRFIHESEYERINSVYPHDPLYSPRRAEMLLRAVRLIGVGEECGVRRLSSLLYYQCHEQP
ncbi:MAG: peptidase [Ignavibacteria bacterium]